MKTPIGIAFVLLVVVSAAVCFADYTGKGHVHTLSRTERAFLNHNCRATATCDLKRFSLTVSEYEVWFADDPAHPTYGKGAIAEYETDSVAALEKYAIVQFTKGCVFHSAKGPDGRIRRRVDDTVVSFGEEIPFCVPRWVIDSQDTDPAYNSDPRYGRFHLLRWNRPGSYEQRTQKYYGAEKPKIPVVYVADYPAGAFVGGTGVRNVALEFKTCIYKAGEVPSTARRDDVRFAVPVACFDWENVYVYDFASGTFRTDLAGVPPWETLYPRPVEQIHLLALLATLFIALAVVSSRLLIRLPAAGGGCEAGVPASLAGRRRRRVRFSVAAQPGRAPGIFSR
ncbi:MAG TPA: hypothetical protein VNN77_13405 [candidate division Zixibacteria bacterium]|nr:hypothetical protein [candidate division Zixibacteria bacterium]